MADYTDRLRTTLSNQAIASEVLTTIAAANEPTVRKMALEQFTVEAMTAQYEQLWEKVLSQERSPQLRVPRPRD